MVEFGVDLMGGKLSSEGINVVVLVGNRVNNIVIIFLVYVLLFLGVYLIMELVWLLVLIYFVGSLGVFGEMVLKVVLELGIWL